MEAIEKEAVIVGGGISGLHSLMRLKSNGFDVTLIEKKDRVGGVAELCDNLPLGPKIFLSSRAKSLMKLAKTFDEPLIIHQKSLPRFLYSQKGLKKVSPLLILKYPKVLWNFFFQKSSACEETFCEFFSKLGGEKFAREVIDPVTLGIFAGDIDYLSMDTLMGGFKKDRKKLIFQKKQKGLVCFKNGIFGLSEKIKHAHEESIHFNTEVEKITFDGSFCFVEARNKIFKTDKVLLHLDFFGFKNLLRSSFPHLFEKIKKFKVESVDIITFEFKEKLKRPNGSGYLIASKFGFKTLGVLFDSDLLSLDSKEVISCFIQNSEDPVNDAILELKKVFKSIPAIQKTIYKAYPSSIFQCGIGDEKILLEIKNELKEKGIFVSGAFPKVGVCDSLKSSEQMLDEVFNITI